MEHEGDLSILKRLATGTGHIGLLTLPGVMRGVFASAQATALEKRHLTRHFKVLAGISTGAPVALYLAGGTVESGTRIYYEECITPSFIHLGRLLRGTAADMDFLCSVFRGDIGSNPVNLHAVRACPAELFFGVTEYETGEGLWVDAKPDPIEVVRASIAIPVLYRPVVRMFGKRCVDGAIGLPFPAADVIKRWELDGLIVLANRSSHHRANLRWRTAEKLLSKTLPPQLREATQQRESAFAEGLRFLRRKEVPYLIVWGDDSIHSLTRDAAVLRAAAKRAEAHMTGLLDHAGV